LHELTLGGLPRLDRPTTNPCCKPKP
jgi:hypothetical protein